MTRCLHQNARSSTLFPNRSCRSHARNLDADSGSDLSVTLRLSNRNSIALNKVSFKVTLAYINDCIDWSTKSQKCTFFCFCIYILRGTVKFRVEQLFQENDIVLKSLNCNKNIESFFFFVFFNKGGHLDQNPCSLLYSCMPFTCHLLEVSSTRLGFLILPITFKDDLVWSNHHWRAILKAPFIPPWNARDIKTIQFILNCDPHTNQKS